MDLNKEIKLSDLFRRRSREPGEETVTEPKEAKPRKPPRERRPLFGRRDGGEAVGKDAPAVPSIPLMRAFNLLPKEEERERGARVGVVQIALALLGLVVVAGIAGAYIFTGAGVTTKRAELDDLRVQLAELEVPAAAPDGAGALTGEGQARTGALSTALAQRIAWDRVLREVSLVIPDDVFLIQLSASTPNAAAAPAATAPVPASTGAAPNALALVGFAEGQESVAVLLSRLAAIPELTSVQLQSSSKSGGESEGNFQFSVLAGVDPLGGAAS